VELEVLVSHDKKFIFLKTVKTAGTSVEVFFEEFCTSNSKHYELGEETRDAEVSSFGIVGARGGMKDLVRPIFFNHMPARELRDKLGSEVWREYFKFTVCRNPFDALVSQFWFANRDKNSEMLAQTAVEIHSNFRKWLREPRDNPNSEIYLIDGVAAVDFFIRYEDLNEGVKFVCRHLGILKDVSGLQNFKSGIRPKSAELAPIAPYYDRESIEIVELLYPYEINTLGYSFQNVSKAPS
jgi:hypothetical protein